MSNCIFCKIAAGEIPSRKIYEDDDVLAFLDIAQVTIGHALVISKRHYDNFLTIPKTRMHKLMNVAQRIGQAQVRQLHATGVNILTNVYKPAGQSVFHVHVHVIPRYGGKDALHIEMRDPGPRELPNLDDLADQIQKGIK